MPGPLQTACSRSFASRTSRMASLTSSFASRTASLAHAHSLRLLPQPQSLPLSRRLPQPQLFPQSQRLPRPQLFPQSQLLPHQPLPQPQPNSNNKIIQFICSPYFVFMVSYVPALSYVPVHLQIPSSPGDCKPPSGSHQLASDAGKGLVLPFFG